MTADAVRAPVMEFQEQYGEILEHSPDGIVLIDPQGGGPDWLIEYCNHRFVTMNGYDDREELVGGDINIVTVDPQPRDDYYKRLQAGPHFEDVRHRRKDGVIFSLHTSTCLVVIDGHELVLGIDREEQDPRQFLKDLQLDVGRTFHTLTQTLLQIRLLLEPTMRALGPDPFPRGQLATAGETALALVGPTKGLEATLVTLVAAATTVAAEEDRFARTAERLERLLRRLRKVAAVEPVEFRTPALEILASEVIAVLRKFPKGRVPRELVRDVLRSAESLDRLTCLIMLRRGEERVVDTDYLVRDVRKRVLTGAPQIDHAVPVEMWSLVLEARKSLAEYATFKGVDVNVEDLSKGARVRVPRDHVVRALNSLLDNAIKYSWWRSSSTKAFVDIRSYVRDGFVYVEVVDYGVPVPQVEIDQGAIFRLGYRGMLSSQRSRPGTGIGLFDAQSIAQRYGGDVTLASRPAPVVAEGQDPLKVPHLVTATLFLPVIPDPATEELR